MNTKVPGRLDRSAPFDYLKIASAAATLAVVGCTVGPDYHPPQPSAPSHYINPTTQAATQATTQASLTMQQPIEVVRWWKTFGDPTLDSLVERAAHENLDLQQASARLNQARAQLGVVGAAMLPEVDAVGSYTRSGAGLGHAQSYTRKNGSTVSNNTAYRSTAYRAGFDANWELDVFGGVRRGIEAADANIAAAVEDRRDVLVSVVAEVAVDYIQLRGYQEQIRIARENVAAEQHTAGLTRKKFNAGFVSKLDVATADAQVYFVEADIPALESSARQTIYALSILLAKEPGALLEELSLPQPIPPNPPMVPIGLPAELLRRRPDIRRAEAQLHAATAQVGVATAELYPQFTLLGSLTAQPSTIGGFGNWHNNLWSFGPGMTWPIFAGGRITANIQVQNAVQQQAFLTYRQTVLTALQEVENALVAYAKEQERRELLVQEVASDQQALDLATRLYNQGQTDFINVLTSERLLFAAQTDLAQSTVNISTDLASLYKALGGGWELGPSNAPPGASNDRVAQRVGG